MRLRWLVSALVLAAILAALEHTALKYFIYWRYPWSDTVMHFLGGATFGALAVGLIGPSFRPYAFIAIVAVAAIGWEIFEYSIGATFTSKSFFLDTSSDLLFDTLGASLLYVLARFTLWRSA